jgi:Asp-tRNA(Asn)/Glu-tRNA(Gln) amidotransferase B subunit
LEDHPDEVHRYRSGKKSLMGFFMGKVMKRFDGAPDPTVARRLLDDRLS